VRLRNGKLTVFPQREVNLKSVVTSWRLVRFNWAIVLCEVEMASLGVARGDSVKVDVLYRLRIWEKLSPPRKLLPRHEATFLVPDFAIQSGSRRSKNSAKPLKRRSG
jgi:hypothetical protein